MLFFQIKLHIVILDDHMMCSSEHLEMDMPKFSFVTMVLPFLIVCSLTTCPVDENARGNLKSMVL